MKRKVMFIEDFYDTVDEICKAKKGDVAVIVKELKSSNAFIVELAGDMLLVNDTFVREVPTDV